MEELIPKHENHRVRRADPLAELAAGDQFVIKQNGADAISRYLWR